jgi:chromosomal replication initiation ATPase DnaA
MNYVQNTAEQCEIKSSEWIKLRGAEMAMELGCYPKSLYNNSRKDNIPLIRGVMMYYLRYSCGYTLTEASKIFNLHSASCYYWCEKIRGLESIGDKLTIKLLNYIEP